MPAEPAGSERDSLFIGWEVSKLRMDAKSQEQTNFSIPLYPYQLLGQNPTKKELGETPPLIVALPAGLNPATYKIETKK